MSLIPHFSASTASYTNKLKGLPLAHQSPDCCLHRLWSSGTHQGYRQAYLLVKLH